MDKNSIILCVDDDSTVLNALRSMFSSHFGPELQVEFAEDGAEAVINHDAVKAVTLTGSERAGKAVAAAALTSTMRPPASMVITASAMCWNISATVA